MDSTAPRYPHQPSSGQGATRRPRPWRRRIAVVALISAAVLLLYALLGFLVLPAYVKMKLSAVMASQLDLPVTVTRVGFNPFTLALTLHGIHISDRERAPLIGCDELVVNLALSSVLHRAWTFDLIRLRIPYARIVLDADGNLNLRALVPPTDPPEPTILRAPGRPDGGLPSFIIHSLEVENGAVEYHDETRPTPYEADIVPVWAKLSNFRTAGTQDNTFAFRAELDEGEAISWTGQLLLHPLRSNGRVTVTGFKLRNVWEYLRDSMHVEIRQGILSADSGYHVESTPSGFALTTSDGSIGIEDLSAVEAGSDTSVAQVPGLTIEGVSTDLHERRLRIAKLESRDAVLHLSVEHDGRTTVDRLLGRSPASAQDGAHSPGVSSSEAGPPSAWSVSLGNGTLENWTAVIDDHRPAEPVTLTLGTMHVAVAEAAYPDTTPARVAASVTINEHGTLSLNGEVVPVPFAADLNMDMVDIPLAPFQAYVNEWAHISIQNGLAHAKGRVHYATSAPLSIRFEGEAGVASLHTVDGRLNRDFVKWDALTLHHVDVRLPEGIAIAEAVVERPYADIIIAADRTLNLTTVMKPRPNTVAEQTGTPHPGSPREDTASIVTEIGAIRIVDGSAHFADLSIQPQVDTGLYRLNGSIRGLSSKEGARAKVSIQGAVDRYAPVAIAGTINPLSSDAFTDLHVSFKNVNLKTLSPYAARFAGYPIVKGKVTLELDYRLSHRTLEAENRVDLEDLTLGKKVESPDATSLPVKLIVALLKDRHGRIHVDLPVRGNLNDPDFHYGRLLWNVTVNLFQKVVGSPFAWLGGLADGRGETLSQIEFSVGGADLLPESQEKLRTVARALEDRPALQLEVGGQADRSADGAALREKKLEQQLAALRRADASGTGQDRSETPDASACGIEVLYARRFGPLPRDPKTGARPPQLTTEVLRARLLESMAVTEEDLRLLAQDRATRIHDFLTSDAAVPSERITVIDSRMDAQARDARVPATLALTAS